MLKLAFRMGGDGLKREVVYHDEEICKAMDDARILGEAGTPCDLYSIKGRKQSPNPNAKQRTAEEEIAAECNHPVDIEEKTVVSWRQSSRGPFKNRCKPVI
jgi:hypothetical protein